jgi:hypothetical protein
MNIYIIVTYSSLNIEVNVVKYIDKNLWSLQNEWQLSGLYII